MSIDIRSAALSSASRMRVRPNLRWMTLVPLIVLIGVGFLWPLGQLAVDSFRVDESLSVANYSEQLSSSAFWHVMLRTGITATVTTVLCIALGYPMAYALTRMPRRVAGILLLVVMVPYFTNILIRSYAWMAILAPNGLVPNTLRSIGIDPPKLVFNQVGVLIGMTQILLPMALLPIYSVMRGTDRSAVKAAQSLGASPAVAHWRVFRPAVSSSVAAAASLVFVSTLGFFVTPALLGGPGDALIAQSIQVRFSNLLDPAGAAAQATILLVVVLVLFGLLFRQFSSSFSLATANDVPRVPKLRRGRSSVERDQTLRSRVNRTVDRGLTAIGRARGPILSLVWLVGGTLLVMPLLVVVVWAFQDATYLEFPPSAVSTRWFSDYFGNEPWIESTILSLWLGAVSATISVVIGGLGAFGLVRGPRRAQLPIAALAIMPLIIPPMIYALGFFLLVAPHGVVGTHLGLIVPYAVLGVPFALVITSAALRQLDVRLERAAESLGARPLAVARHVILPALRPALASSFVFAFLAAFDDVVVAIFMSGSSAVTLPLRMFQDIRLEVSPRTAVVAVILLTAGTLAVLAKLLITSGLRRARILIANRRRA